MNAIRSSLRDPLRRSLEWLLSLRDERGRILCPEHRIEHTGKSAGAAVTAAILGLLEGREDFVAAAIQQGRRMVANLVREGTSPCHTFRPGRHDPFNCSNSVIDGGACSSALAELVLRLGTRLSADDARAFRDASLLHARTYLRYAVLDKGIPAQRAWGLTGLAGAWALEPDDELSRAALEAVGVLAGIQHADGSFPYHPLEWGAEHVGASDVSSFYQSRISAFTIQALERMGRDPRHELFAESLRRGLDFALALAGPDGRKCGWLEAKPWYWGAEYEVASNVFDVFLFASGWRLWRRREYAHAAQAAFQAWAEHLEPNGRPRSHLDAPGRERSYQCPVFWAGHAEWIARALADLEACAALAPREHKSGIDLSVTWFPNAELARLEDPRVVAWVRGARAGFNLHHGSPIGGGLVRVVRATDGLDLLARSRAESTLEGEWNGTFGARSFARGWKANREALRFSLWLARNHWRGRRYAAALDAPLRAWRDGVWNFGGTRISSAFELAPRVSIAGDGLTLESRIALRDGTPLEGSAIERRFSIDGEGLSVGERVLRAPPGAALAYRLPKCARDVQQSEREVRYRLSGAGE